MANLSDVQLVNVTTQDYASEKDWELINFRWDKMRERYMPRFKKAGLIKWTSCRVWNKEGKIRNIHIFEYQSKKAFEDCQKIWKETESEIFAGVIVKMVSDKGLVFREEIC